MASGPGVALAVVTCAPRGGGRHANAGWHVCGGGPSVLQRRLSTAVTSQSQAPTRQGAAHLQQSTRCPHHAACLGPSSALWLCLRYQWPLASISVGLLLATLWSLRHAQRAKYAKNVGCGALRCSSLQTAPKAGAWAQVSCTQWPFSS